jgi:hypothetical protein
MTTAASRRNVLKSGAGVVAAGLAAQALPDAAVAQGIAGIMARQRMSPYLPGIRSRLWRSVPATPGSIPAADSALPAPTAAAAPVLALLSRLPLDDEA